MERGKQEKREGRARLGLTFFSFFVLQRRSNNGQDHVTLCAAAVFSVEGRVILAGAVVVVGIVGFAPPCLLSIPSSVDRSFNPPPTPPHPHDRHGEHSRKMLASLPQAYKYIPYGKVGETIPYLLRRAQENSGMLGGASHERSLLVKEICRRIIGAELV